MNTNALATTKPIKSKELIIQLNRYPVQTIFQQDGANELLKEIRAKLDAFKLNINNEASRKEGTKLYGLVASTKVEIDDMGKQIVADVKAKIGIVDGERKKVRDTLDAWRDELKIPLLEFAKIEPARIAAHNARLEELKGQFVPYVGDTSAKVEARMTKANELLNAEWEEFAEVVQETYDAGVMALQGMLDAARISEDKEAELEKLRAESVARDKADAEKKAADLAIENERKAAQAEKDAAAQRVANAEAAQKQVEKNAQAEADAAAQRERDIIAQEKAHKEAQDAARERDKSHRGKIHREALEGITACGVDEAQGKIILQAIASGKVKNLKIIY